MQNSISQTDISQDATRTGPLQGTLTININVLILVRSSGYIWINGLSVCLHVGLLYMHPTSKTSVVQRTYLRLSTYYVYRTTVVS